MLKLAYALHKLRVKHATQPLPGVFIQDRYI